MVRMKELCYGGAGGCSSSGGTLIVLPEGGQDTVVLNPGSRLGKCPANTRKGERGKQGVGGLEEGREWKEWGEKEEMREGRERRREKRGGERREREGGKDHRVSWGLVYTCL